jgi:hypothetical protein
VHLYIHAMEASKIPEKALPYATTSRRSRRAPGTSCTCPRTSTTASACTRIARANKHAIAVDEAYFKSSPSDPLYKSAYYPHNIHFVMVSAQMGGDSATALSAASKLDAVDRSRGRQDVRDHAAGEGGALHDPAQFSDPDTILRMAAPPDDLVL